MRARLIILIMVAFTAAGTTVFAAREWLSTQRNAMASVTVERVPEPAKVQVLVARVNLPAGVLVNSDHLRWQAWPDDSVPNSYAVKGKLDEDEFVGAVVRLGIAAGEPISRTRVVHPGENGFLAALLSPGMRAITVPVNATTGISGFVFPGDRVDLILTHQIDQEDDGNRSRQASETVLSNVRILAIDQSTNDQGEEATLAKTATLELTPKQAEIVTLITDLGRLSLSLRSLQREDETAVRLAAAGGEPVDLLAQPKATRSHAYTWDSEVSRLLKPPSGTGTVRVLQVVRGNESIELEFARGGK